VALIRTDVSEDRIASIFGVNECEQAQSEEVSSCIYIYIRYMRRVVACQLIILSSTIICVG
jgi:hypothetical protein